MGLSDGSFRPGGAPGFAMAGRGIIVDCMTHARSRKRREKPGPSIQ